MSSAIMYALNTGRWSYISERWINACRETFSVRIPEFPEPITVREYASRYKIPYDSAKQELIRKEFLKIGRYYIKSNVHVWRMYTDAKKIEDTTKTRISVYSLIRALNTLKATCPEPFCNQITELIGQYAMNKLTRMGILGSVILPEHWGDNRRAYYITNYFELCRV